MEDWVEDEAQRPFKSCYETMEKIEVRYLSHNTAFVDGKENSKILLVKV